MTSEVGMDDDYREIESYLRQAQEEIGQALSNLETTGSTGSTLDFTKRELKTSRDPNYTEVVNITGDTTTAGRAGTRITFVTSEVPDNARSSVIREDGVVAGHVRDGEGGTRGTNLPSPRDVNANRAGLTTARGGTEHNTSGSAPTLHYVGHPDATQQDSTEPKNYGSVLKDFLSIFAQNDLLEDSTDSFLGRSPPDCWNFTLPNPRKRPDRPRTLTPPPRLQGSPHNPYKNQDWRSYVRGEYGFNPIHAHTENNAGLSRDNHQVTSSYTKPKPTNPHVSCVRNANDIDGSFSYGKTSLKRAANSEVRPVRPIPTKPQLGIRLGAQALTVNRKITLNTGSKCNGFQRPRSMNDSKEAVGVSLSVLPPRGASSAGNINGAASGGDRMVVQTENVVQSLPSIRSPTIERKNINFPTEKWKFKDTNPSADSKKTAIPVKSSTSNSKEDLPSKGQSGLVSVDGESHLRKVSSAETDKKDKGNVTQIINKVKSVTEDNQCVRTPKLRRTQPAANTESAINPSSSASRSMSPDRTAHLSIPPPPKVEEPPRSSKVMLRQPSPEKRQLQRVMRSRSNSGGEADLGLTRTERRTHSAFEKVSTSTQTDKRQERRRKSDPGHLSRGLLKAARTKFMGIPAYIKPSKLDSTNNNIMTAVVKPMPAMGNKQVSLQRHNGNDNNNKNTDMNRNRDNKSKFLPVTTKTSQTNVILASSSAQETQCNLMDGAGDGRNNSGKDITVQVEVFVSCSDKERGTDSRSRGYYDTAGRIWGRERRVSVKPLMPVIAEVQKASDDSETDMEAFDSSTSSSTQSRRGGYARSLSSSTTSNSDGLPSPDGPAPPLPPRRARARPKKPPPLQIRPPSTDEPQQGTTSGYSGKSAPTPPGSPMPRSLRSPLSSTSSSSSAVSLLDSLHRRYYPGMYHYGGVRSAADMPNARHSNPEVGGEAAREDAVPHSKSASFADGMADATRRKRAASTPERLSDSAAQAELQHHQRIGELLAQLAPPPAPPSEGGSSSSQCSTLSPPTLRRPRPAATAPVAAPPTAAASHDSSEAESSYGSLSSAKGVDVPAVTCRDNCPAAAEETLRSLKSDRELAEIEAVEACKWLRAAGFPQYAQMYEDQLFPIDIASVEKDHDFLDTDSIQSLFRRLNTLNKCANMKIEAPPRKSGDESDEEEQCALSDRWRFQRSSRRWSRRDLDDLLPPVGDQHAHHQHGDDSMDKSVLRSCSSHDSVLTDTEPSLTHLDDSPLLHHRSTHRHGSVPDSPSYDHPAAGTTLLVPPLSSSGGQQEKPERRSMSPISPRLRRAASERFRGAKIFLKRIESFKTKKSKKKPSGGGAGTAGSGGRVEISGPVVMDSTGFQERMDRLGCVDISPTNEKPPPTSPFDLAGSGGRPQQARPTRGPESPVTILTHTHSTVTAPASGEPTPPPPEQQQVHFQKQASPSPSAAAGLSPLSNKRNGRVFLDSSGSFPSGSSTLSDSHSEDPLHLTPPPTVYPGGHRRNHSSSDIMDMYSAGGGGGAAGSTGDLKQGSYPMLVSNGYIDMGNGSQINYRTGSFNMGNESEDYKDSFIKRTSSAKSAAKDSAATQPRHQGAADATGHARQRENRLSVYDNVPVSAENASAQHELDMILHDLFENINGLSQSLGQSMYDENITVDSQVKDRSVQPAPSTATTGSDSDQGDVAMPPSVAGAATVDKASVPMPPLAAADLHHHHPHLQQRAAPAPLPPPAEDPDVASASSSTHEMSDGDTAGSREEDGSDQPESRERRDSGVGSSLTRAPSDRRRHRIRWHSFVKSHRPSLTSRSLQISNMSAGQLMVLRKLSLLKVTALMEKYSPTNRSGWNWIMPKFIKRFKVPDYKDKQVFGVPLLVVLQRSGQPLPQCILYAMRSLRRTARDAVGIFRKSGVRSRIQKLHNQIESNPECMDFDQLQAYDVADLLKQYFRELPECLLTNKLSETFIASFTHVPPELRLDALQAAVMLLPDENREVLQSLLLFLSDMAEHASENQMTASNLAVCFAPSLFHMCGPRNNPAASPKRNRKNMGIPDQKDLLEQKAAHECLTSMITDCKSIFSVPEEMLGKCRLSYIEQGDPVSIEELVKRRADTDLADHTAYMESCIQGLLRESHNKFKGWISVSSTTGAPDVAYKKVGDGHPLRLWKCAVDVEAPPVEVLNRVLHERHLWDEDLLKWRVVEKLDMETEVFQYVLNNMAPHPTRDFTELRSWRTNLPKGACVLVSTSVEHPGAGLIGGLRAVVLASRYLIEPCGSGKSRLTHMCRIDLRGHTPEWYNKAYGHLCANYVVRIRDSFKQDMDSTAGPETKV